MFSFRIGSIPVRVHLMFFLTLALLGGGLSGQDPRALVVWLAVAFVGVLLHELGHALVGRSFGLTPQIDLIGFGGLTSWTASRPVKMTTGRRVAISAAGPLVSVVLGTLALAWSKAVPAPSPQVGYLVDTIIQVNLVWGIFNLLPIMPMDGGNILFAFLQKVTHGRGEAPARMVSLVLAVGLGIAWYFASGHSIWNAVFVFAFFVAPHVRWFQSRNQVAASNDAPAPPF